MKMERVSENKIKITVSFTDMEDRNLNLTSFNYSNPETQELFWDMMEQAENELGFDATTSQLCVEAYPGNEDEIIITITRLPETEEFESIQKYIKNKYTKREIRTKRKTKKLVVSVVIYSFNDLEDACMMANTMRDVYNGESSLYKCKDTYYLQFCKNGFTLIDFKDFEPQLGEYGNRVQNVGFYEGYLNEYGEKIILNNAIDLLQNYF
jgi:Negative regulator of genetic competence, sporulation and motility